MKPKLILIFGPSASGKSFYSTKISEHLNIPVLCVDKLKDAFDTHPTSLEDILEIDNQCHEFLREKILEYVQKRKSFILDTSNEQLKNNLLKVNGIQNYAIIQLFLWASPDILFDRFKKRWESGERPRHHRDDLNLKLVKNYLDKNNFRFLNVSGPKLEYNTENFDSIPLSVIFHEINNVE